MDKKLKGYNSDIIFTHKKMSRVLWVRFFYCVLLLCCLTGCIKSNNVNKQSLAEPETEDQIEANCYRDDLNEEIETIRTRKVIEAWSQESYNFRSLEEYEENIVDTKDGSYFSFVNFDEDEGTSFGPYRHLYCVVDMALQYGEKRILKDSFVCSRLLSLIEYYAKNRYESKSNWWWNTIGIPQQAAIISMMFDEYMSETSKDALLIAIKSGIVQFDKNGEVLHTGGNLTEEIETQISYGVLTGNSEMLENAVYVLEDEMKVKQPGEEGIMPDLSYHQAPSVLCMAGSYGTAFAVSVSHIVCQLWGTSYELSDRSIELFIDHILDGQSYFHRGFQTNYFSLERQSSYASGADQLYKIVSDLASLEGMYRQDELSIYCDSFVEMEKTSAGFKYFPDSYVLVKKTKDYNVSVKGNHVGVYSTMIQNDQGLLNYNLSCGGNTCYMSSGYEYMDIGSVMNYSLYPGITSYLESDEELLQHLTEYGKTWGVRWVPEEIKFEPTEIVEYCDGYVDADLDVGVLYMQLKHETISGLITYIIHGDTLFALGCNLNDDNYNGKNYITSINQSKAENVQCGNEKLEVGNSLIVPQTENITNGNFSYCSFDHDMVCKNTTMQGALSRNGYGFDETIKSEDVFQIYIDYGKQLKDENYAYAVSYIGKNGEPQNVESIGVSRIENSTIVQLIEFEDVTVAVFHEDGTCTIREGETIEGKRGQVCIR